MCGEWAEDVVNVIHLESTTPTYVVPEEEPDAEAAIRAARALVDGLAIIWLPGRPKNAAGVQSLYDARAIVPGAGLVVRLGARPPEDVEPTLQRLGLWSVYRTVPASSAEDAAVGLVHLAGLTE